MWKSSRFDPGCPFESLGELEAGDHASANPIAIKLEPMEGALASVFFSVQ